jgi:pimeloyl-ACP methyl ester carboxylesterase
MDTVTSNDRTVIAFDRAGEGPPVVVVGGGSVDRMSNAPLVPLLADRFTVFNYDRRGRGDSSDIQPYSPAREIEDIGAVIEAAGGEANLYGTSSGAALALAAAASGQLSLTKLALWEAPFIPEGQPRPPADTASIFRTFVDEGDRGGAVEFFMSTVVGLPDEFVTQARQAPFWADQEAIAHTLAYDAEIMGDYHLPTDQAAAVKVPTLVMAGGASFPWMATTAEALTEAIPDAEYRLLEGQTHDVSPEVMAGALKAFFRT